MTSEAKTESNRRNALKSTGPRSDAGKLASRVNAVRHGVWSDSPTVLGESAAAWEEHRAGVVASLGVAGAVETALAERVAVILWRLQRVARYEALAASADIASMLLPKPPDFLHESLQAALGHRRADPALRAPSPARAARMAIRSERLELKAMRDSAKLATALAKPPAEGDDSEDALCDTEAAELVLDKAHRLLSRYKLTSKPPKPSSPKFAQFAGSVSPEDGEAWPLSALREVVGRYAGCLFDGDPNFLQRLLARHYRQRVAKQRLALARCVARQRGLRERRRSLKAWAATEKLIPTAKRADQIVRYESHLNKQLTTALHELERLQARRGASPVPPPAALDVTVTGMGED